jgi:hypothetical protein
METIKKNLAEVVMARNALDHILSLPVPYKNKKSYWLDRNREELNKAIRIWENKRKEIFDKYAIDQIGPVFIPLEKYDEFKKELLCLIECDEYSKSDMPKIFSKYEVHLKLENRKSTDVPLEKQSEYYNELSIEAEANFGEIEINFWKVSGDDKLEDLFGELSGNEQKAIFYMLNDIEPESKIHLIK